MYKLSEIMDKRGYQLNAITLLFEATGFYCLDRLEKSLPIVKHRSSLTPNYSKYQKTNKIRHLVRLREDFKGANDKNFITIEIKKEVINYINGIRGINDFIVFINSLGILRNNLAHGNNRYSINDVKTEYQKLKNKFEELCVEKDILSKKDYDIENSLQNLIDKFNNR